MSLTLRFDKEKYEVKTIELEGKTLRYRAFEHIPYVERPVAEEMQVLNIFVPEKFYEGESINGYSLENAPIFLPNTAGGYMPGPCDEPGPGREGGLNAIFEGLLHGYVVVSPGIRGREMKNKEGKFIGMAPAALCDYKAAVRYLRHNREAVPGNTEKIISNGTSAGGAMSSLLGATGNHPDYEPYLREMGAAEERDDIFAASCYCPITNLDHADMAYEWEFEGLNEYHRMHLEPPAEEGQPPVKTIIEGSMDEKQQKMAVELKKMFPAYVNSLKLKDEKGQPLMLDEKGEGTLLEFIMQVVKESAQGQLDMGDDLSDLDWMEIRDHQVISIDFKKYVKFRTRMKDTPAFDSIHMRTPENELFGTPDIQFRHFTEYSREHSAAGGELADAHQIKMMNPMEYIRDENSTTAKYYRIRHGAVDRDTSLSISALLTAMLREGGTKVDFAYPWGRPHSGDYDLEELFAWIDEICRD